MSNRTVTLVKMCKTANGWKRYPAAFSRNGRIRPQYAMVDGTPQHFPEGDYLLRWYEGSKTMYRNVGPHAGDAFAEVHKWQKLKTAKELVRDTGASIKEEDDRVHLRRALDRFISATEDRGSYEAAIVYRRAADEFLEVSSCTFADEITSDSIATFHRSLRKRGLSDRTVFNRHSNLIAFLLYLKLDTKAIAPTKPKYEEAIPEIYNPNELKKLFASISDEHLGMTFELLLKTGMRDQEAIYLDWSKVDLERHTILIRNNPDYGFRVKDCEQRKIPLPIDLALRMEKYREANPRRRLVTGTKGDKPHRKLLRALKRSAKRAGLNCGHCEPCRIRQECERWFLHKFRATYITSLLRSGMDLRTVMKLSGHADLESVMRYLSPADDNATQLHVNKMRWL